MLPHSKEKKTCDEKLLITKYRAVDVLRTLLFASEYSSIVFSRKLKNASKELHDASQCFTLSNCIPLAALGPGPVTSGSLRHVEGRGGLIEGRGPVSRLRPAEPPHQSLARPRVTRELSEVPSFATLPAGMARSSKRLELTLCHCSLESKLLHTYLKYIHISVILVI